MKPAPSRWRWAVTMRVVSRTAAVSLMVFAPWPRDMGPKAPDSTGTGLRRDLPGDLQPALPLEPGRAFVRGERLRIIITLDLVAAVPDQEGELPFGFHAFRDRLQPQAARHRDHRP